MTNETNVVMLKQTCCHVTRKKFHPLRASAISLLYLDRGFFGLVVGGWERASGEVVGPGRGRQGGRQMIITKLRD